MQTSADRPIARLDRLNRRLAQVAEKLSVLEPVGEPDSTDGATTLTLNRVIKQLISSEAAAREIIAKNPLGLAVVNQRLEVLLFNTAAKPMLEMEHNHPPRLRFDIPGSEETAEEITWQENDFTRYGILSIQEITWLGQAARLVRLRDVTQERIAEGELLAVLKKSMELNALKSQFISTASHEFRTPLTSILASSELLQDYAQDVAPETRAALDRHLRRIIQSAQRMTVLLDDVLLVGRAEAGRLQCTPMACDVSMLCEDLLADQRETMASNLEITFKAIGLPARLLVDEGLLHHIIANLISNAIKYSPDGGKICLQASWQQQTLTLVVSDQGIGIPEEDLETILGDFHRAGNVGVIAGTGLGLPIVKRCVDAHGGKLDMESTLGQGSRFTVQIPTNEGELRQ